MTDKTIEDLASELDQKNFKDFMDEVIRLQIKHNIWIRALIFPEGPQLDYYSLDEQKLSKIKETYDKANK